MNQECCWNLNKIILSTTKSYFAILHALKKWCCYIEGVKDLTILTNHKLLEFFKTQSKLSRRQTGWMKLTGNFDFKLTYRSGRELLQAKALSCIYVQELQSYGSLNPDWPMYYTLMKNDIYSTNVLNKTLEKLVKNKSKFKVNQGTVCFKTEKWTFGSFHSCVTMGWNSPQVPPQLGAYMFKKPLPLHAR